MKLIVQMTRLHGPLQNYGVIIHDPVSDSTAAVDAGEAAPILEVLDANGWTLDQLWISHHHHDHTDAIGEVKAKTGCIVYGPHGAISGIDTYLEGGDQIVFGNHKVDVLHTPGHTLDMLNFHIAAQSLLFTSDTMFVMGCGRLFEGTPAQMYDSLSDLAALPGETVVYCAHEYTLANAQFAADQFPDNLDISRRKAEIEALRAQNQPTVPTTIAQERQTNPFLLARNLDHFSALRAAKDKA